MAGTYQLTIKSKLTNAPHTEAFDPGTKQIVQNGVGCHAPVVDIGTSEEDLSFGDLSTEGRCEVMNLDDTNYVDIGPKSGGSMVPAIRLKPGEPHAFRISPGQTWAGQANTAACKVQFKIYED